MIKMNGLLFAAVFMMTIPCVCLAQKADNTRINQRDKAQDELTADNQGEVKSDVSITQRIRKALIAEEGLSMYAHNVKIITKDGMVTLKGPVKSQEEKDRVEGIALKVVTLKNLNSEIDIAS